MKRLLLVFTILPLFLSAQESREFVVKKATPVKLFYSTENTGDTASLNYLLISSGQICHYGSFLSPAEEFELHGQAELQDSSICYNYRISRDSLKFITYGKGNVAAVGDYTYTDIYTFYHRQSKGVLRSDILFSNNTQANWNWNYTEFVPPKKQ